MCLITLILISGLSVNPVLAEIHPQESGVVWYVSPSGNGSDGLSWDTAFTGLQDALSAAASGDEIWVAAGVYTPGPLRTNSFYLLPGGALYGGFAGSESSLAERDWVTNPTILSGDMDGNDINTDGNSTAETSADIVGDNSYHVVYADGSTTSVTESTILDGFVITAGKANGSNANAWGGGFYCNGAGSGKECSPSLRNVTFSGNTAAEFSGAMFNNGSNSGASSPILTDVTFSGNSAEYGGAMVNAGFLGTSSPSLTNVTFSGNAADVGGAMYNYGDQGTSSPSLTNVTFLGNTAGTGGAMYNYSSYGGTSSPSLINVTFSGNAADAGGAMVNYGSQGTSSPNLNHVTFSGNTADVYGGAMYNYAYQGTSSPNLNHVTFSGNTADAGGAMFNDGYQGTSNPSLTNVTFFGNTADAGGAMYNYGNQGTSSLNLNNVTFSGNTAAEYGGAMYNYGLLGVSSPSLSNVVLWGNTAPSGSQIYNSSANITFTTSLVQGGIDGAGIQNYFSTVTDGGGNLAADPMFVDAANGDVHLQYGSPAIDTGTNAAISLTTDLDGSPRKVDGDLDGSVIVDMGAYEYNRCPSGSILYVDQDAASPLFGESWNTAFQNPVIALNVAAVCSGISEIWVAGGVYTPGLLQTDSFHLLPGVALYGGFTGDEDSLAERDWVTNPTILSGDIDGNDKNADDNSIAETPADMVGGNSYHVVYADGSTTPITESTILDGFIITAGQANESYPNGNNPNAWGGGFYCNGAGSGKECSPSFRNVTFLGNTAAVYGGAMFNDGSEGTSSPSLTNVTFSGNTADVYGGAMFNYGYQGVSSPSLTNVTFFGNTAAFNGGAMYNYGLQGTSSPILTDVTFLGNTAGNAGGAMYNYGLQGTSSPNLINVAFSGNTADAGGAMINDGYQGTSSPNLNNVTFSGNTADAGGAMYNFGPYGGTSSPILTNVTFSGNSAAQYGGAMYNYGNQGTSSPNLNNVTFSGNTAAIYGGAMYNFGTKGTSSPNLSNVILWGNTAPDGSQIYSSDGSVTLTTSLVEGGIGGAGIYNDNSTVTDGGGNLAADPMFVDAAYGDVHLQYGSPAIDTGTNAAINLTTDLDGNPRFVDGDGDGYARVDMGAYENQITAHRLYLPMVIR
jgi:predicted outer membrane repeat protein